jgi:tRNA(His) 5'-end guanylyltransferase
MKNSIGDRMKRYEKVSSGKLTCRTPVIIRVDGRSFHNFPRKLEKPFDPIFIEVMQEVAKDLVELDGTCVAAYVQSDEISILLKDWSSLESQPFFQNKIQKLCSIFASKATSSFIKNWMLLNDDLIDVQFDARCFNIPREDLVNYFIWRQQDWTRNSVQMLGHSKFSQKQMQGKNCDIIQDMLFKEFGINWNDIPTHLKRGTFVIKDSGVKIDMDCPIITKDRNYLEKLL